MLSLRSAQGRAILAGVVLVVLLAALATLAVWRTRDMQQQHHAFQHTSSAATALESANAQFRREQAAVLSFLLFAADSVLLDDYHDAAAAIEQHLSHARAEVLASGDANEVLALDDLSERIANFNATVDSTLPILLQADPETRLQLATAGRPEMWSASEAIVADLQEMASNEQQELAARTVAADRSAATTLWLLTGFGTAAFLVAAGTVAMLIVSVVRPLASLRASARAITAGDLKARAKVSGPEEVTSLAGDFNQMADALAARTQEFIDTANLTGVIILRLDKDGRVAFLNDAACQFLGTPEEEMLGAQITDCLHPDDVAAAAQAIREMAGGKLTITGVVTRYITPAGTRVAEWNAHPLFDEEGRYAGLQGTGRDITERKRAEDALRESEEKWRSLAENAPNIIIIADRDGTIQFVNRTVSGITTEETLGSSVYDFVQPEYRDVVRKSIEQVFQTGKVGSYQVMGAGPRGRPSWYETQFGPIKHDGQVVAATLITTDITERKRAEEELRESEERYRDLFENANDLIQSVAPDGSFAYVNHAWRQALGYAEDEIPGLSLFDIVHPDSKAYCTEIFQRVMAGEKPDHVEATFVTKDGRAIWVEGTASCRFEDGKPVATRGIFRDITERKRAQEELRESEERFRSLSASAPIGVFLTDLQGDCIYANPRLQAISGLTLEESLRYGWSKVVHPDDRATVAEAASRATRQAGELSLEFRILTPEGELGWAHVHTSPLFSAQGKQIGRVGTLEDITARKQAEEALRESESKYRMLLSNLPQRIFFKDKSSVYVSCNDNYARDLHVVPDEIAGKTDYDFYPQELADKYRADDKRIMASGKSEDVEERYLQDGQETFVHTVKTPVRDEKGNVVGILGIFWDITERKKMEEERERLHAELELRAITDGLTGLYNHAHFFQRLGEEIERSSRYGRGFSILMMDIDNFKHYNDTRGHQAGDEALRLIAGCVRTAIRRSDIASRYGGDEFAAILLHADSPKAQTIIKRMNRCIARRLKDTNDPAAAWIGLSVGVACFPDDATNADELVKIADAALYDAKRAARARDPMQQGQAIDPPASPSRNPDDRQPGALSAAASSLAAALQYLSVPEALADLDLRTIAAVGAAAEIKDPHIRRHQERVSQWAATLAEQMGLPSQQVQDIRIAGLLHDLGKVSISEHILNKPGKLTEAEYAKIKEHSALGAMIVAHVDGLQRLVKIIRHHHERFDGNGYPDGLAGGQIPLQARVLAVVDVFDAMTHERSYRKALSREEAISELERGAATQFDPAVVRAFLTLLKRQGKEPAAPAKAAVKDRQLTTAKAGGQSKG
jgi:diguanylate cyclase (GGDEF)-like protein/PAS domain S-box-containing protein/putative nucleotidyltransferase with HDIG domain